MTRLETLFGRTSQVDRDGVEAPVPRSAFDVSLAAAVRGLRSVPPAESAFHALDALLRPRLLRYFLAHGFAREDAEELVQKTLVRVFQGVGGLREESRFLGWLFAIARNLRCSAHGQRRREQRHRGSGVEGLTETPDRHPAVALEQRQIERQQLEALQAAVERLPPQQRECLRLRVREDLTYEDVAATLGLSVNTVRNHLAEARRRLRQELGQALGDIEP